MNIDDYYFNSMNLHKDDLLLVKICLEYNFLSSEELQKIVTQYSGRQLIYQIREHGYLDDSKFAELIRLHNEKTFCLECGTLVTQKSSGPTQCKNCFSIICSNNDAEDLSKDKKYGKYKLLEKIGEGSVGVVYKAIQEDLDRIVALKILKTDVEENVFSRFKQEAQSVAILDHPSIVSLYDIGQKNNEYFLAMEYVAGKKLTKYIKKRKITIEDSLKIIIQIIRGLQHAHSKKIIHRDIKPDNIIITPKKIPKITDFGLARRLNQESRITRNDIIMGTPVYMSPEQARGDHNIEYSTDIYSTGVVFYEMLCGELPFSNSPTLVILNQIVYDIPSTPKEVNPDIPSELSDICMKALEKETKKRYQKIKYFGDDIETFLEKNYLKPKKIAVVEELPISKIKETPKSEKNENNGRQQQKKLTLRTLILKEDQLKWYDVLLWILLGFAIVAFYRRMF